MKYEWKDEAPKEDGHFYYYGETPSGERVTDIVRIKTKPGTGERWVFLFQPAWRDGNPDTMPQLHHSPIEKWLGQWAGPEYGLNTVTNDS